MPSPSSSSANPGSSASNSSYLPTKGKMLRVLTATQNTSALVFSVFLGVHMVSPIAAAVGGIQAADRTMLIAREYYLPLEPLLVYAPLAVHLSASASKRVLINLNSKTPFKPTILQMSGYILPWFLLPHILSHRLIPSSPVSPIHNLSPSELGFEFVGWGVNKWPVWSALGYGGLVWFGMIHSSLGMMKIVSWLKGRSTPSISVGAASTSSADGDLELPARPKISKWRKVLLPGIMVSFLALITIGLVRVARETSGVSKVMASRYEAVYASMPLARSWS